MTTKTVPDFNKDDLDEFEEDLDRYLTDATPQDMHHLVYKGLVFIEKMAEDSGPETFRYEGWTHLNNATAAIGRASAVMLGLVQP